MDADLGKAHVLCRSRNNPPAVLPTAHNFACCILTALFMFSSRFTNFSTVALPTVRMNQPSIRRWILANPVCAGQPHRSLSHTAYPCHLKARTLALMWHAGTLSGNARKSPFTYLSFGRAAPIHVLGIMHHPGWLYRPTFKSQSLRTSSSYIWLFCLRNYCYSDGYIVFLLCQYGDSLNAAICQYSYLAGPQTQPIAIKPDRTGSPPLAMPKYGHDGK